MTAGCHAAGQQVAAGRCLPVEHFASHKDAGLFFNHEVVVKLVQSNTTGSADGFCHGPR